MLICLITAGRKLCRVVTEPPTLGHLCYEKMRGRMRVKWPFFNIMRFARLGVLIIGLSRAAASSLQHTRKHERDFDRNS